MEEIQTQYRDGLCQLCSEIACTLNLDEALRSILQSVHSCIDVDASSVLLLDPSHQTLSVGAARKLSEDYMERGPVHLDEDPVSAEVLRDKVVILEDMPGHPAYKDLAESEGLRSGLATPLKSRGHPVGTLWVFSRKARRFSDEETSYLKTIAAQAGVALANARLHQNLHIISQVGRAVTSHLEFKDVLRLIVENGSELFYAKGASVFLRNLQQNTLELKVSHGLGAGFFEEEILPIKESLKECLGQMVVVSDISKDQVSSFLENLSAEGVHSVICTPLKVGEKTIGLLRLYLDHIRDFSEEDQTLLEILADFSAIAIENARLYHHVKRDYEDLTKDVWDWYDWGERPPKI